MLLFNTTLTPSTCAFVCVLYSWPVCTRTRTAVHFTNMELGCQARPVHICAYPYAHMDAIHMMSMGHRGHPGVRPRGVGEWTAQGVGQVTRCRGDGPFINNRPCGIEMWNGGYEKNGTRKKAHARDTDHTLPAKRRPTPQNSTHHCAALPAECAAARTWNTSAPPCMMSTPGTRAAQVYLWCTCGAAG